MGWEVLNLYGNRKLQSLLQNRLQWELHNTGKDKNGNPLYDLYVNGRIVDRRLDHNAAMYRLRKANIRGQDSYTEVGGGSISGARLLLQWEIDRLYDAGMSEYLLNDYLNEPIKKPAAWVLWQTVSGMVSTPKYDLLKDDVVIKKDVGYLEATRVVFKNIRPEDTYREYLYHDGGRKEFLVLSGADVRRYWSFENSPYFVG